jgi:alpha-L-rhamnosidase
MSNPLAVDAMHPELSWIILSSARDVHQTAYQILVASSPERLASNNGDLWNSGKVVSAQTAYVPYTGAPLRSQLRCWWKVRVWDDVAGASQWSVPAVWTMGLVEPSDWHAHWITASKWFMPADVRPHGLEVGGTGGWADVDLGEVLPIDEIDLYANTVDSFPSRFKVETADNQQFDNPRTIVDQSAQDYKPTGRDAQKFPVTDVTARFVRLEIVGTGRGTAVRQMEVLSGGKNIALMRPTKEYGTDWSHGHSPFLVDGMPNNFDGESCPPDACPTVAAPLLRKSFMLHGLVKHAMLYVAAHGMADVTVNGHEVGEDVNGPPFSDYTKRIYYVAHDVTSLLRSGENVVGATLGNGYFSPPHMGFGQRQGGDGPPRFLAQAHVVFADGTSQDIVTDNTWTWNRSEITFNDFWTGYSEDRRLAKPGWDMPGYKPDHSWLGATEVAPLAGKLCAAIAPAVHVAMQMKPDRVDGNHAYFHGLTAGWPRVQVNGHAGQVLTINGINESLSFRLEKDGPAVLEPRFMMTSGPLDLSVDGLTEPLAADAVTLQCVAADLKQAGDFTCSNAYLNDVYKATLQTHRNYDVDFPADPTREKQGWTQDAQGFFDSAAYLTDVAGLYRRWWWDMADNQDADGYVGSVLPVVGRQVYDWNSPWWSGVTVYIPWEHYLYYGDRRFLEDAYEPMRKYVDFLGLMAKSGVGKRWDDYAYFNVNQDADAAKTGMIMWNGAGDWLNPTTDGQFVVPAPMTTMPGYYYYARVVGKTAELLGKTADAEKYAALADDIKARFNAIYFHSDTGLYGDQTDNETAQVLPIAVGLVPDGKEKLAYDRLIDAIHARKDHVGCGFIALPWLLQIMVNARESALANKMVNQQDYPSWKSLMHDGIIGEGWHGGGAQMPSTGGSIVMWMYQSVLGIRPDPAGPGFAKFIIAPQPDAATGLTSAHGHYDSVHGRIASDWTCANGKFALRATIPANTTATVIIPTSDPNSVTESGKPAATRRGVRLMRADESTAVYDVGSGTYAFASSVDDVAEGKRSGR